jgi:predicted HTH transcriptional regulator
MSQDELRELDADEIFCKPVRLERLIEKAEKIFKSTNKDAALLNLGCEAPDLDYKSDIDLKSKEGRASFAKDVIAFANNGGGHIIVGVSEPKKGLFEKTGVTEAEAEKFEVTNINKAIAENADARLFLGRIYIRTSSAETKEVTRSEELRKIWRCAQRK